MTESSVHVAARCESCQREYRVPSADRTYACKACGGTVRPHTEASASGDVVIEGFVTCTECQALSPAGARYCVECGATLELSDPVPGRDTARWLRAEASKAMRRASKWINAVTVSYRLGAAVYAAATLLAVLALVRTEVPVRPGVLVVALTALMSAVLLIGAIQILFRPVLWTLSIAVAATTVSIVHRLGADPFGLASLGSAAWAVLAWAALVPTYRFRLLIAKHKDLYITHHASSRTIRALKGHTAHERHERLVRAMQRAAHRATNLSVVVAGGLLLASALGTWLVLARARPAEFEPARERFEAAWNDGDVEALGEFFEPGVRAVEFQRLNGRIVGHGWRDELPAMADGHVQRDGETAVVEYELAGLPLSANWMRFRGTWFLAAIDLPVPPFEPVVDAFIEAWRSSKPEAIAAFFALESRPEMLRSIRASVEDRGWTSFPEIVDVHVTDYALGEATATFKLERSKLRTEWHVRIDGIWRLHGLRFPSR